MIYCDQCGHWHGNNKRACTLVETKVKYAGMCGVDAGMIMVGDPCYAQDQQNHPGNMDWLEFCDLYRHDGGCPTTKQLNYDLGHPGLGVVFDSGFGDGTYPVYVTIKDFGKMGKRVVKAEIFFDEDPYTKEEPWIS